jgi:hypothetical protein
MSRILRTEQLVRAAVHGETVETIAGLAGHDADALDAAVMWAQADEVDCRTMARLRGALMLCRENGPGPRHLLLR